MNGKLNSFDISDALIPASSGPSSDEDDGSFFGKLRSAAEDALKFIQKQSNANTGMILGIPIRPIANLTKTVGQGLLRQGASIALSKVGVRELSFPNDPELDSVVQKIFGGTPKSFGARTDEKQEDVKEHEGKTAQILGIPVGPVVNKVAGAVSRPIAALMIGGGFLADFTGFGGKAKAINALAKADKAEDILSILARLKVPAKDAEKLVEPLRLAKTSQEVEAILKGAESTPALSQPLRGGLETPSVPGQADEVPSPLIHGDVGAFDGALPQQEDSVKQLIQALKEAKPIRAATEAGYTAERAKRIADVRAVREVPKGEAGFYEELGKLKGELPKEAFDSLRGKITQTHIDDLFNMVTQSPRLGDFEKITAQKGLAKMFGEFGGQVPTAGELKLLEQVFPPEVIKELLEKRPLLTRIGEVFKNIINIPRSLQSSFDLSAPFRQGVAMIGHPVRFTQAFFSMFKSFGSERAYQALMDGIAARPTYKLMRESKLAITDLGRALEGREEAFLSNFAERIPGVGKVVRASGRAYTGFLNKLRADVFDDLLAKATSLGHDVNNSPSMTDDLAKFINSATGRGSIASLERAAELLNGVFFSPRLMMSRINLLNPYYYMKLDPFVRKEAIKIMLTSSAMALTVLGLAKAGGADVGADPTSADFGKIKIGDTRLDIFGGFQQYIKLGAQLKEGKITSSTSGKVMVLGEGYKPLTRKDVIIRFFTGKENPIASFIDSALEGQNVIGEDFEAGPEFLKRFIPMFVQDAVDAMKEWGVGKGALLTIPSIFGIGTQTYSADSPKTKSTGNPFNYK